MSLPLYVFIVIVPSSSSVYSPVCYIFWLYHYVFIYIGYLYFFLVYIFPVIKSFTLNAYVPLSIAVYVLILYCLIRYNVTIYFPFVTLSKYKFTNISPKNLSIPPLLSISFQKNSSVASSIQFLFLKYSSACSKGHAIRTRIPVIYPCWQTSFYNILFVPYLVNLKNH